MGLSELPGRRQEESGALGKKEEAVVAGNKAKQPCEFLGGVANDSLSDYDGMEGEVHSAQSLS